VSVYIDAALVVNNRVDPLAPPSALPIQPQPACVGWLEQRGKGIYSLRCCCTKADRQPVHAWRAA
jgi:hypothetical protein